MTARLSLGEGELNWVLQRLQECLRFFNVTADELIVLIEIEVSSSFSALFICSKIFGLGFTSANLRVISLLRNCSAIY